MFTTALQTRWYRILTRKAHGEAINENWINALNIWLCNFGTVTTGTGDNNRVDNSRDNNNNDDNKMEKMVQQGTPDQP